METEKKKSGIGKKLLIGLLVILAIIVLILGYIYLNKGLQMKYMTNYVMKNLSEYNWSGLQMEDPVKPTLTAALGDSKAESVEVLYGYMKDSASKMTWKIKEMNPDDMTSTVEVTYIDGSPLMGKYGEGIADYIYKSLKDGSMGFEDIADVLNIISDTDNKTLFEKAIADCQGKEETVTTSMKVNFQKMYGICIPNGTSDEVNDIASAGLGKGIDGVIDQVAERLIPQVVDMIFQTIKEFDLEKIESYAGTSLEEMTGFREGNPMYYFCIDYLRACNSKLEYKVGPYDPESRSIQIECSHLTSKSLVKNYLIVAFQMLLSHPGNKIPMGDLAGDCMYLAAEKAKEERTESTVTITFDQEDYGKFEVSKEMADVVTANLTNDLGPIASYMAPFMKQ